MDIHPLIDFGDFPIYNLAGGIGLILALFLLLHNFKNLDISERKKDDILKILAVSFLAAMFFANFINWFVIPGVLDYSIIDRFRVAGLTYYFGLVPFFLISYLLLKLFKYDPGKILNIVVPSVLIFHAFGRIGCFLGGCCYGKIINFYISSGLFIERFPASGIEAFMLFIFFAITQFWIKEKKIIFYFYAYPCLRFLLEFGRDDIRGKLFTNIFSPSQEISLLIIIFTTLYLVIVAIGRLKSALQQGRRQNREMQEPTTNDYQRLNCQADSTP